MSQTHHTVDPKFTYFDKRARKDVVLYVGLLDAAHRAGLVAIETEILQFPDERNGHTCIVQATVRFWSDDRDHGARFQAIGDANPQNVGPSIAPHFIRMAETRAKARALRDALNIGMVTAEELGGANDRDEHDEDAQDDPPAPPDDLAIMRSMAARPEARKAALHRYYSAAESPADLNARADLAYGTGIDADVLKAAFRHHHDRLSKQLAPASYAG